ncbi:MAG: proteasome ATPase, partial [Bifidobacterium sp.]|nr:proteasome ATPase [Bifidobacterium sp.]
MGSQETAEADRLRERNHALAQALTRATEELAKAKGQLARFTEPPLTFATMLRVERCTRDAQGVQRARAEVVAGSRRMVVAVDARVDAARLSPGMGVTLDENMVLVGTVPAEPYGPVRTVDETLPDGRLVVRDQSGGRQVVGRAPDAARADVRAADRVLLDPTGRFVVQALPGEQASDLLLEETPDVT